MERKHYTMSEKLIETVKSEAEERDISQSELIRSSVRNYLEV